MYPSAKGKKVAAEGGKILKEGEDKAVGKERGNDIERCTENCMTDRKPGLLLDKPIQNEGEVIVHDKKTDGVVCSDQDRTENTGKRGIGLRKLCIAEGEKHDKGRKKYSARQDPIRGQKSMGFVTESSEKGKGEGEEQGDCRQKKGELEVHVNPLS